MSSPHGTRSRYVSGCRCDLCRKANARWQEGARLRREENLPYADVEHGTADTYINWLCRCRACTEANTAKGATRRAKLAARCGAA